MILTLTGASGAGKSTLIKALIPLLKNAELSPGCTTRPLRENETAADVVHMSHSAFQETKNKGEFLWTVEVHGQWYGTLKQVLKDGLLNPEDYLILALTSNVLPTLRDYAQELGHPEAMRSIYVLSPGLEELRSRLNARETAENVIERRLQDCLNWDKQALKSDLYDYFVPGEGNVQENAMRIISDLHRN